VSFRRGAMATIFVQIGTAWPGYVLTKLLSAPRRAPVSAKSVEKGAWIAAD
jgi:hypothetical protein